MSPCGEMRPWGEMQWFIFTYCGKFGVKIT